MKTLLEATNDGRPNVGQILNLLLADEFVIYLTTRDYHWNVTGSELSVLHPLLEEQYTQLETWTKQLAEKIRSMGAWTHGGWLKLVKAARLSADSGSEQPAEIMLTKLLALHETHVVQMQKDLCDCACTYRDPGTAAFLTGLIRKHEKIVWVLRACPVARNSDCVLAYGNHSALALARPEKDGARTPENSLLHPRLLPLCRNQKNANHEQTSLTHHPRRRHRADHLWCQRFGVPQFGHITLLHRLAH